jgi:hypothetical protein
MERDCHTLTLVIFVFFIIWLGQSVMFSFWIV